MTLRIEFNGRNAGGKFRARFNTLANRVQKAATQAAKDASKEVLTRGRRDIRSAGRFGARWTRGLHADVVDARNDVSVQVYHDVPYFMVFERGKVIKGKPLLWIPLSFARDARKVRARDYPHPLFRVDRGGGKAPLLLSAKDGKPKYFGKASVTIPKKFHILEICRDVGARLRELYNKRFRKDR